MGELNKWENFYLIVGGAAGALIGLQFVVVTLIADKPALRLAEAGAEGDVIWTPPGVKHWHGATLENTMIHTAVQESLNGKVVDWMEKVTDEEYKRQPQN
jgi:hypothetical protein